MHQLRGHISSNARLFPDLTAKVFEQLLFGPYGNHWAVTRPILSIMLADEASFASYRAQLMATQTPENQAKLEEAFVVLLSDVQKNLDLTNRDRFAQRLSNFRQKVRDFLTL
jgi:exportin-7